MYKMVKTVISDYGRTTLSPEYLTVKQYHKMFDRLIKQGFTLDGFAELFKADDRGVMFIEFTYEEVA